MIMPFLIEAIEDAPPELLLVAMSLLAWLAVIGAGSIVWDALRLAGVL